MRWSGNEAMTRHCIALALTGALGLSPGLKDVNHRVKCMAPMFLIVTL
jgi:hypothetical protein